MEGGGRSAREDTVEELAVAIELLSECGGRLHAGGLQEADGVEAIHALVPGWAGLPSSAMHTVCMVHNTK